jgi:hypothetical protein
VADGDQRSRTARRSQLEQRERLLSGRAWEDYCAHLAAAGRAILDFPLPGADGERLRAEGFRYLLGLVRSGLYSALELADPLAPRFIRNPDSQAKWGAENADNLYLWARIDPRETYRVFGERRSAFELLIEVKQGFMQLGDERVFETRATADLTIDGQGRFSILLAAERPASYAGDFIPIHPDARFVQVRQYLLDWESDTPASFEIQREGGSEPAQPSPSEMADRLEQAGEWTLGTTRYWMQWVEALRREHSATEIPAARHYAGGAVDIYYGNSWYVLGEDEALIFECEAPEARVWQIQLCDAWFKTLDYAHRQTSLNSRQAKLAGDGMLRVVIAHQDPGVACWLDAGGNREGVLQYRWIWTRTNPQPTLRRVPFAELVRQLPADTPRVTAAERRAALDARAAHVQRRERAS